jgi:hypothetical protein
MEGRSLVALAALAALLSLTGCPPPGNPVTGGGDDTAPRTQSETAVSVTNVRGKHIMTVAYNDESGTASTVLYTPVSRTVLTGASLMGWSYSTDDGVTWTHRKAVPPVSWAALWGDPAIESDFYDQRYVFMSSLAIPLGKMPAGGIVGPVNDFLGGACIARSEDGGMNFAIHQCVFNNFHFYDGGSIVAAGLSSDRRVFAAFVDWTSKKIDVYASPTDTGTFTRMEDPFPNMVMVSHPRLRFDRDTDSLYVAAIQQSDLKVYLNRFSRGWGKPIAASTTMAVNPVIALSDRTIRTAYQFSYDVGTASDNGDDDVRMVYTVRDPETQRYYLRGTKCRRDLSACGDVPQWGTTPGNFRLTGDQFNPNLRAFQGFFGIAPVWKLAYMTREDDPKGNTVSFRHGNLFVLANGTPIFVPFALTGNFFVCSDLRLCLGGGGYWGDYNDVQFSGIASGAAQFLVAFTDSSNGCTKRWEMTSEKVHVRAVEFQ